MCETSEEYRLYHDGKTLAPGLFDPCGSIQDCSGTETPFAWDCMGYPHSDYCEECAEPLEAVEPEGNTWTTGGDRVTSMTAASSRRWSPHKQPLSSFADMRAAMPTLESEVVPREPSQSLATDLVSGRAVVPGPSFTDHSRLKTSQPPRGQKRSRILLFSSGSGTVAQEPSHESSWLLAQPIRVPSGARGRVVPATPVASTSSESLRPLAPAPSKVSSKMPESSSTAAKASGPLPTSRQQKVELTKPRPTWLSSGESLTTLTTGQVVPLAWTNLELEVTDQMRPTYKKGLELEHNSALKEPLILESFLDFRARQLQRLNVKTPTAKGENALRRMYRAWANDKSTTPEWVPEADRTVMLMHSKTYGSTDSKT